MYNIGVRMFATAAAVESAQYFSTLFICLNGIKMYANRSFSLATSFLFRGFYGKELYFSLKVKISQNDKFSPYIPSLFFEILFFSKRKKILC